MEPNVEGASMPASLSTSAPTSATILVVDDQPPNLQLLTDCLESRQHVVAVALDGEEGLQRAVLVRPDLILLDVQMPGIDGFETCRRLKADARTKDIPVIFMTALADTRDKVTAFAAGAVDYVTKPFDETEVMARIDAHVRASLLARRLALQNAMLQRANADLEQLAIERVVRAKAEGESAALRRLLEERDQMLAEREEMIQVLAHEVRQPLNNASAALETATQAVTDAGGPAADNARVPLVRAQHVLDHVIGTLNNTLAAATLLTSGRGGALTNTEIDTFVALVVHDISPQDRRRLHVDSRCPGRTVQLEPVLMRLAVCNLLVNALNYSPPPSPVTWRISEMDDPLALVFEVIDEGQGFAPELLPTIFAKGTRGPHAREKAGAGLGLYIVDKVVRRHGGRVEILPQAPRGSIVRMIIPQGVEA